VRTTGPGESALLLLDAVDVLTAEGINYAVVGAMAGSVHGIVRASFDADAVLSLAVQRAPELERKLKAAGFRTTLRRGDPDDPIGAVLSLSDTFENRVDLLIGLRGLEPTAFARAIELTFEKTALRVIGLEDFIAMKVFAGGPQDLADARAAISAGSQAVDLILLRRLAGKFGGATAGVLEKLLADADGGCSGAHNV
jgi:hypothetical protein